MTINVLIAGSDAVLRKDLPCLLDPGDRLPALVVKFSGLDNLLHRVVQWQPDVLVLEQFGDEAGFDQLLAGVREAGPGTRTLVVAPSAGESLQLHLLQEGVCGVVPAPEVGTALAKAIREVHGGQLWFTRAVLRQAIRRMGGGPKPIQVVPSAHDLTPREAEIVHLIGAGLSNKEIARELQISDQTVKTHLHHVYVKLHCSGRFKAFLNRGARPNGAGNGAADGPPA